MAETSVLIVDEISMMSAELLELLNYVAQNLRKVSKFLEAFRLCFQEIFSTSSL